MIILDHPLDHQHPGPSWAVLILTILNHCHPGPSTSWTILDHHHPGRSWNIRILDPSSNGTIMHHRTIIFLVHQRPGPSWTTLDHHHPGVWSLWTFALESS